MLAKSNTNSLLQIFKNKKQGSDFLYSTTRNRWESNTNVPKYHSTNSSIGIGSKWNIDNLKHQSIIQIIVIFLEESLNFF